MEMVGIQVGEMPSSQSGVQVVRMQILVPSSQSGVQVVRMQILVPSLQSGVEVVGMLEGEMNH